MVEHMIWLICTDYETKTGKNTVRFSQNIHIFQGPKSCYFLLVYAWGTSKNTSEHTPRGAFIVDFAMLGLWTEISPPKFEEFVEIMPKK